MDRGFGGKLLSLALVTLVLFVVIWMIQGVVGERLARKKQAVESIEQSWGREQTVSGPWLVRKCEPSASEAASNRASEGQAGAAAESRVRWFGADVSRVDGTLDVSPRSRGIYTAYPYLLRAEWTSDFAVPPVDSTGIGTKAGTRDCAAFVVWSTSDAAGVRAAKLTVNGEVVTTNSGALPAAGAAPFVGVWASVDPSLLYKPAKIKLVVEVAGSEKLNFKTTAKDTQLSLAGNWPHLSYGGDFLPANQNATPTGFAADWRVRGLELGVQPHGQRTFGLHVINPVDHHTLSDRATKYALLFVALTFAAVLLFEVLKSLRVHPVQYALVGFALSIFFLLLVSLSEHMAFERAYLIAATACVALLVVYAKAVLRGMLRALGFGVVVSALYGSLFVLLRLEQMALVAGTALLFAVLTLIMITTRKVDWYALNWGVDSMQKEPADVAVERNLGR